jgi:hypothetical protein
VPGHPLASKDGYALEHRYVLHEAGIEVPAGKHVHHINGNVADNRIENLEVKTPKAHVREHAQIQGVENQYGHWPLVATKLCQKCGAEFRPWTKAGRFCSRTCANARFL